MTDIVPLNDLTRRTSPLREALLRATSHFLDSGRYVLGGAVQEFERSFAAYCGVDFCVGVANGTDALEIALKAAGVRPGDKVALCANAAMYGTTAVLACSALPVYVDIDPTTDTMCRDSLRHASQATPGIKAIITTHLYGRLADMPSIVALAKEIGAKVVEDCAQAHGASDAHGNRAGALGDVASFSFYPTKNLGALGDAGAVTTSHADIAEAALQLRQYGWTSKYHNSTPGGRNSRLDELQALYLLEMLPLLDTWNHRRQQIALRYAAEISSSRIAHPGDIAGTHYVAHLYVAKTEHRDALRRHLAEHGVMSDIHYPVPDHRQPCHHGLYATTHLPHTDRAADTVITLPCFPELSDSEVDRVIDACNRF